MIKKFSFLFAATILGMCSVSLAQDLHYGTNPVDPAVHRPMPIYRDMLGDSSLLPKSRLKQQMMYSQGNYTYPPKPKNMWEIGINGGTFFVSGDTKAQLGYGYGASIRKAIGYTLSLRGQFIHGTGYGLNWEPNSGLKNNPMLNGHATSNKDSLNYFSHPGYTYYNYQIKNNEISVGGVLTLNNIGFHRKAIDRKVNLYGIGTIGGHWYITHYDMLKADGVSSYASEFKNILQQELVGGISYKDRKQTVKDLKNVLDGTYETAAEGSRTDPTGAGLFGSNKIWNPVASGGLAVAFHISRRVNIQLEHKVTFTQDDLLDGNRWQEHPNNDPSLTRDFDTYHYTSLGLNFSLGKSGEPLWWQNPNDYTYDMLKAVADKNADQLIDTDDDGVIDKFDDEPNTPAGYRVDTHGVTIDCDKDGIPDNLDPSPCGSPIGGGLVDPTKYVTQAQLDGMGLVKMCNITQFPSVHFDLDKYYIKPEFFAALHEVALAMIACPDKKMVAVGYTDNRESDDYNMVLSWERVNKTVDYLVTKYGISRDRFIVKFDGEKNPKIPGLPDNSWAPQYEPRQYQNRRVEFHWAAAGESGPSTVAKPAGPKNAGEDY